MRVNPAWVAVFLTGLAMLWAAGRYLWPLLRKLGEFLDDWRGEDERPGYARRPGMPERIARLESEFQPNHGSSMKDSLNRVENALAAHMADPHAHVTPPATSQS